MKSITILHQKYIKIHYAKNYDRIRISTGVKIENKAQFTNGKLKCSVPDYINKQVLINKKHQEVESLITNFYNEHKNYPSVNELRQLLKGDPKSNSDSTTESHKSSNHVLYHFQEFMKAKASDFSINGKRPESIKDYRNVLFYQINRLRIPQLIKKTVTVSLPFILFPIHILHKHIQFNKIYYTYICIL